MLRDLSTFTEVDRIWWRYFSAPSGTIFVSSQHTLMMGGFSTYCSPLWLLWVLARKPRVLIPYEYLQTRLHTGWAGLTSTDLSLIRWLHQVWYSLLQLSALLHFSALHFSAGLLNRCYGSVNPSSWFSTVRGEWSRPLRINWLVRSSPEWNPLLCGVFPSSSTGETVIVKSDWSTIIILPFCGNLSVQQQ